VTLSLDKAGPTVAEPIRPEIASSFFRYSEGGGQTPPPSHFPWQKPKFQAPNAKGIPNSKV
jgi:hypothetical protein